MVAGSSPYEPSAGAVSLAAVRCRVGARRYLAEPSDFGNVLRCEDNLALAPARMREASCSSAVTQPSFTAAHERCSFGRFKEFQVHVECPSLVNLGCSLGSPVVGT